MVGENLIPFAFGEAIENWAIVIAVLAGISLVLTVIAQLLAGGPSRLKSAFGAIGEAFVDVVRTSPRRVWALAILTFKEAARRRALLVFVIFGVLFMFAGWFLTSTDLRADLQIRNYVSFVLTTISYLIIPLTLLLACWGIPEDIRRRSMHTVVTKPVRRSEIVLGRVMGLSGILTVVLLIMGGVGYVWVVRQIPASQQNELVSRVPIYGIVNFYNSRNEPVDKGVNVGDVWTYRSYVEGASKAHATFTLQGITPDVLVDPDGPGEADPVMQIESNFEAFRTFKGDMERGVLVQYTYVNPADPSIRVVDPNPFAIQEFQKNIHNVPTVLTAYDVETGEAKSYDLFKDIVAADATVELPDHDNLEVTNTYDLSNCLQIEVSCLDRGQYLGVAQPDLFVRTPDLPFAVSFFKAVFGIWLMVVLIVTIGVTASCFVKGPVATFLTFAILIVGAPLSQDYLQGLLDDYITGADQYGGGPVEASVRLIQHMNPTTEFEPSIGVLIMEGIDSVFLGFLWVVSHIVPDLRSYDLVKYPAYGFDIDWARTLLPAVATTFGFLIPCLVIGHLGLRFRELEAK